MDKIHNIDCLEFMKGIKDNSYDVVITSPPYNIGRNYNLYNDNRSDYIEWQKQVFNEVCRVLKSNGHLFLNIASTKNDPFAPYKIAEKLNLQEQLMTTRWFVLLLMIGLATLSGCQSTTPNNTSLPNVLRLVINLIKQEPRSNYSQPIVKMKMGLKLDP